MSQQEVIEKMNKVKSLKDFQEFRDSLSGTMYSVLGTIFNGFILYKSNRMIGEWKSMGGRNE